MRDHVRTVALLALAACSLPDVGAFEDGDGGALPRCDLGTLSWVVKPSVNIGEPPSAIALADVDNDGKLDIVVAHSDASGTGSVSVVPGNGDGTFRLAASYRVGASPAALAVGYLHSASLPDIVVGNSGETSIDVLVNDGHGRLSVTDRYQVAGNPFSVSAANVDNAGLEDVVVADMNVGGKISVLLNDDTGKLLPETEIATTPSGSPRSLAVGNVNGQGLDVIVTNNAFGTVSVLVGDGNGGFQKTATDYSTDPVSDPHPIFVAVKDLNHDSRDDIVVVNSSHGQIAVLRNDRNGGFPDTNRALYNVGGYPVFLAVANLDQDTAPDVVAVNDVPQGQLNVLLNDGQGGFSVIGNCPVGANPKAVAVGDVDGDGKPDLVVANAGTKDVSVLVTRP